MATFNITIGNISAEKSTTNAKATAIVGAYADEIGATGTPTQRLEAVVQSLVDHMRDVAINRRRTAEMQKALQTVSGEAAGLTWDNG